MLSPKLDYLGIFVYLKVFDLFFVTVKDINCCCKHESCVSVAVRLVLRGASADDDPGDDDGWLFGGCQARK